MLCYEVGMKRAATVTALAALAFASTASAAAPTQTKWIDRKDGFSAILVAVPLVLPFAAKFHLNPFHMAVMFLLNLELAFLLPPTT